MSFRVLAGFSWACLAAACNLGKSDDQSRPLPAPEPASSAAPSRPAEAPATATPRPKEPERAGPKPTTTSTSGAPKPDPTHSPGPASTTDAGSAATATPTALPTPTLPPFDAGTISATCIPKCQASLSACISKPVPLDAGFPSLESMSECKKVFEECRSACE